MNKLLKLLSGYDNYLDEGALYILEDKLSKIKIDATIVYQIPVPMSMRYLFKELSFLKCENRYGDRNMDELYDLFMSLIFTKNILVKNNKTESSVNKESWSVFLSILQESTYDTHCIINSSSVIRFETVLLNHIRRKLNTLGVPNTNIIGIHRFYDDHITFNPNTDNVMLGYFNNNIIILRFIPKKIPFIKFHRKQI